MVNPVQKLDIVIPVNNEELNLKELVPNILKIIKNKKIFQFRIIFINDGSSDGSADIIKKFQKKDKKIKIIQNKNKMGQTFSYKKYLTKFKADYFLRLDADNQDNPTYINDILESMKFKYDLIITKRKLRKHSLFMIVLSFLYDNFIKFLIKRKIETYSSSMVCFKKSLINGKNLKFNDHRYLPLIAINNGAKKIKVIKVVHEKRKYGVSKYNILNKIIFAIPEFLIFYFRLKKGTFK